MHHGKKTENSVEKFYDAMVDIDELHFMCQSVCLELPACTPFFNGGRLRFFPRIQKEGYAAFFKGEGLGCRTRVLSKRSEKWWLMVATLLETPGKSWNLNSLLKSP